MIQTIQHEAPSPTRESLDEIPDSRLRLHAPVSLLAHVETVLGRGRDGRHHALALTGNIHLPELRAELTFGSHPGLGHGNGNGNGNGNGHAKVHRSTATIVPRGFTMAIPLQYLALPAQGEGSDVWALTPEPDHDPPWMERYVGRLEREPLKHDRHVPVEVTLDVTFSPQERRDGCGESLEIAGELSFERPMHVRFLCRDQEQSMGPPLGSDSDEAVLIVAGFRTPIARQTVSSPGGRDLWMTVRIVEADGRVVCVEEPARRVS